MVVEVTKEKVVITGGSVINSGEVCVNNCRFILPACFDGLCVTAVFNNIPVPLVDNECYIPSLEKGNAVLGVYAYRQTGDDIELMYSPAPCSFFVAQGSYSKAIGEEESAQISQYEQYCKMIAEKYETLEKTIKQSEYERENIFNTNEIQRQSAETLRQNIFEANENMRNATFNGAYTNLLKNYVEEIPTEAENKDTTLPAQFPCKKTGAFYNEWVNGFRVKAEIDAYIIQVDEGDRFNISNYSYSGINTYVVDDTWAKIQVFSTANSGSLVGGIYAMPSNAKYLVLHSPAGSAAPYITKVSEPVILTNDTAVPNASKFITQQKSDDKHLVYVKNTDETLAAKIVADIGTTVDNKSFASGIYPLESGKKYIVCYNNAELPQYAYCGYICDENFKINKTIQYQTESEDYLDFDEYKRLVFTASETDKYVALNCFDFNGNLQFGEATAKGISKPVEIGNALFDGKNGITLGEIGGIDRSLVGKKWVSYGDSITWGSKLENGEKHWQDYIIERYSIDSHKNMGIGSTSIAYRENETYPSMCTDSRLNSLIAENPDIVTILGGANDLSYDIPIGTDEDIANKNKSTFKGAYAYIIDKILTAKPDTTLVLMGMYLAMKFTETRTHTLKEYAQATKEIAEYFGLPFVDLNKCGFNAYNFSKTDGIFTTDGIHPNAEGVKRIAMVVSKWFDTFKGTIY